MIKQRIMLTEIPEVEYVRYMRTHNSGNIRGENLHIWAVERNELFVWCMLTLALKWDAIIDIRIREDVIVFLFFL